MNLIIHYPASMKTGRIDRHSVKVRPIIQAKHEQNRRFHWYPTNIGFADDQLFPGSIGISPPYLGHSSFLRQAQIQPFKYVTTAFSAWQGIDHLVSGQILVVKRSNRHDSRLHLNDWNQTTCIDWLIPYTKGTRCKSDWLLTAAISFMFGFAVPNATIGRRFVKWHI